MRSRRWNEFGSMRERVREQRLRALHSKHPVIRRTCMIDSKTGRLLTGHKTRHRCKDARRWRMAIRLIHQRTP